MERKEREWHRTEPLIITCISVRTGKAVSKSIEEFAWSSPKTATTPIAQPWFLLNHFPSFQHFVIAVVNLMK